MNFFSVSKKTAVLVLAMLLLGIGIWFRDSVSGLMSLDFRKNALERDSIVGEPGTDAKADEGEEVKKPVNPPYSGRDPVEVRPNAGEMEGFSESQKQKMYSGIVAAGRTVKENPDYFSGWIELGLLKKIIGDYEGAADAWEYAGLIRPQNSLSFSNLGELYWKYLLDYPKAEASFRRAIQNKPDDIGIYMSLSDLYSYSYAQKRGLADDALLEGLEANPDNTDLIRWLAALYEREKEYARAIEWWKKVLEKNPSDVAVKEAIANLEEKLKQ
ncbi:MAG: hypothetical protein A2847_02765 [Candidatus Sungbacteria bacterium RIFCSPHIGHO2_01_FULL_50_25]|uniref:Uncharacterized protein n=1 Tax=Candidatus Sungbacteria bacterium RIFCSPHIGHO2_01_FULL_50_25 TaxID=1802265 RepID=A0A1G2KCB8_9BACT|nr:MAG: hypothetical protein A2847_02765 [Candidatus Sungbacteria bacterium RIFCSPHIGHO2_01_FULL_50_25]